MGNDALENQRKQIAQEVGFALAQWTITEGMLTYIFVSLMDRTRKAQIDGIIPWQSEETGRRLYHTAFNAIISFETRLDVISALVPEARSNKDLKAIWPILAKKLRAKYKSRHQIAHFLLENVQQDDLKWKAYLAPFANSTIDSDIRRFGVTEVRQKRETFRELGEGLKWFRDHLEFSRARQRARPAQEPPLIQRARQSLKNQSR